MKNYSTVISGLTEGEKQMFELKAAIYAGGSIEKLIKDAVASYQKELKDSCFTCNKDMEAKKVNKKYPFEYGDNEVEIEVSNVPVFYCHNCKNYEEDIIIEAEIEKILDARIKKGDFSNVDIEEMLMVRS